MTQGVDKQIGAFPAIEAEGHLVKVGWEMLCADLVPVPMMPRLSSENADSTVLV